MYRIILPSWHIICCCFFLGIFISKGQAVETIVVGEGGLPWSEGGGDASTSPPTLLPDFRLNPRTAGSGNIPGGVIDFEAEPGWIVPTQIDPERNLFEIIREQGGAPGISSPNVTDIPLAELELTLKGIIDGSETVYVRKSSPTKRNVNPLGEHIDIDLGARFGIDRIRFYPSPFFPGDFLKAFELKVNDGTAANLTESGNPLWTLVLRNDQNSTSDTNVRIPLQFVRYIRLTSLTTVGFEIDEIELYGRGYVPSSRYLSDVFDLGEKRAVWGNIRWMAEAIGAPDKSSISVRTRTGSTPTPLIFTRAVTSRSLSDEPFRFEIDRISFDRAKVGLVLAPVELPEQIILPAEYDLLSAEIKDWIASAEATYTFLDEAGNEQTTTRTDYEASPGSTRGPVRVPESRISPDTYKPLDRSSKDWLEAHGARYYRRANIDENVPYDIKGNLLNANTYNRLPLEERGPILDDTENWSPWSAPYPETAGEQGVPITSPAPRQYFQFEIRFESDDLAAAHRVDFLSFEFSTPPVVQRLVAEIFPREVQPGQSVEFTYAVRPFLDPAGDLGFDSFEIQTPVPIERLVDIQIANPDGQIQAEQAFGEDMEDLVLPFRKGDFTLTSVEQDRFRVNFPRIITDGALLKIHFITSVLRFGTTFAGWALNEGSTGLPQPAVPGDVAQLYPEDVSNFSGLTVFIDLGGKLLGAVQAFPNPFTPNGDGINDRTEIRYDILKLTDITPVQVYLYNLAGQLVRILQTTRSSSGRYAVSWDARDQNGQMVPPGLYLYNIEIKADSKKEEVVGTVAVVY